MAYWKNDFGALVLSDPAAATVQLHALYQQHSTRRLVAAALGVNEATLARWTNRLEQAGSRPPRGRRGWRKGRPRKLAA